MMIFLMIFTWRLSEAFLIPSSAAFWARASSSPAFALVFVSMMMGKMMVSLRKIFNLESAQLVDLFYANHILKAEISERFIQPNSH